MSNPLLAFWQAFAGEPEHPALRRRLPALANAQASSAVYLILRRMRAPLIVLIVIYAISVLGLTLVPGQDADGKPWPMGFFHAFYFMSYTATTIGFGEIPHAFTDAQRLWVTFCIYLTVIGWAYAIGTLLALLQDRGFRQALAVRRLARQVRRLREPFVLLAGYGQTGQIVARSLDALGRRFVVLDIAPARIDDLELEPYHADVPALVADARSPEHLALAGLGNRHCEAVIALTNDDEANLAVTMAAALLRPDVQVIARTVSAPIRERMRAFGQPMIVDPFDRFGDYLRLALRAPASFRLLEWLTGEPGTDLPPRREPPRGRWVVCGYGRFGREIVADLRAEGLEITIIEPGAGAIEDPAIIVGYGTEADVLARVSLDTAAGFIAATDNDTTNLSLIAAVRCHNPELFVVARRNDQANAALFDASAADYVLVPAEVIAHEVLGAITSPLLQRFLAAIPAQGEAWAAALVHRLTERSGARVPYLWRVRLVPDEAPALLDWMERDGHAVRLGELLQDPGDRGEPLAAVVLLVVRGDAVLLAPPDDLPLRRDDAILCAGRRAARRALHASLQSDAARDRVLLGYERPASWLGRILARPGG